MHHINIPSSTEECVNELSSVGALITAKEWTRAAIVTALVGPAPGRTGRPKSSEVRTYMTVIELAAKGIVGLSSTNTVERYRDIWCAYRPVPQFGEAVDLTGLPKFPPTDDYSRNVRDPERVDRLKHQADWTTSA